MELLSKINKEVPNLPGCYIYYDQYDTVIYVGKAKKLKKRMQSYFNRANNTKTQHLVNKIIRFEYYITNNEKEALVLENNLIKKHNPFYNIMLKDDKTYPYIILTQEKHPRLRKTRQRNQKAKYYGPYASMTVVNKIIDYINKEVPLVKCKTIPKEACIYYHLGQCYAPCIKQVTEEEINTYKKQVANYLEHDLKKLTKEVEIKMLASSEKMDFEKALEYKTFLNLLKEHNDSQFVQFANHITLDYIDYYKDDNFISLCILNINEGKLENLHRVILPYYNGILEEVSTYLFKYYERKLNENIELKYYTLDEDIQNIMKYLFSGQNINLDKKTINNIQTITLENAREYYRLNIEKITKEFFKQQKTGYQELEKIAGKKLEKIEMIDISHTFGENTVGALITYINGKKEKKLYRKYKIKQEENFLNDYGAIKELLDRRIKRGLNEVNLPDLLIIDGGKGQVSSALEILKKYKVENNIQLIGLSKDEKHRTKGIVNKNLKEKILDKNSYLYKFLYELQEEVHRYAIDYHRQVKIKSIFTSELDQIEGIGPKRKKQLIEHFEYVDNIKKATKKDLQALKIPETIINNIIKYFQKDDNNG